MIQPSLSKKEVKITVPAGQKRSQKYPKKDEVVLVVMMFYFGRMGGGFTRFCQNPAVDSDESMAMAIFSLMANRIPLDRIPYQPPGRARDRRSRTPSCRGHGASSRAATTVPDPLSVISEKNK